MKSYLEETGLFTVDAERTAYTWNGQQFFEDFPALDGKKYKAQEEPKTDPEFKPDFSKYDLVLSNFGWNAAPWPEETQKALENYVGSGGGLVIVHAANNSFGDWEEYNKMIAVGGWGDRTEKHGPYLYYNDDGNLVRDPSKGTCGSHGPEYAYTITVREGNHPITKGLPTKWLHAKDELYDRLRGPAENVKVLATAYSDAEKNVTPWEPKEPGTARHEPMLLAIDYGKGRVFHTPMGHSIVAQECVGFITALQRGAEWAATGKVTQTVPDDFPGEDVESTRTWSR